MGKLTVIDVAKTLLFIESMPHKKLQKLCYYVYSWYLAFYEERLFNGPFQAWIHGPVHSDLYQNYKEYGWRNIPQEQQLPISVSGQDYGFVKMVYDAYGDLTGDELEAVTHDEDPWIEARRGLPEYEPSNYPLNDDTIRMFYRKVSERAQTE